MANTIVLESYPKDHKIFSEGLRIYGMPSRASIKTSPTNTDGATPEPKPEE